MALEYSNAIAWNQVSCAVKKSENPVYIKVNVLFLIKVSGQNIDLRKDIFTVKPV